MLAPLLKSGCILFLNFENNLYDSGPNKFSMVASREYYASGVSYLGGNYAIDTIPSVSVTTGSIQPFKNKVIGLQKYTIEANIFISGLPFGVTNQIFGFSNAGINIFSVSLLGATKPFSTVIPPSVMLNFTPTALYSHTLPFTFTSGAYTTMTCVIDSIVPYTKVYMNGNLVIYDSGNLYSGLIRQFQNFTNMTIGASSSGQYIKNFAIYDNALDYIPTLYSGNIVFSGYNFDTSNINDYNFDIITNNKIINKKPLISGDTAYLNIDNIPLYERGMVEKILFKKNGWVSAIYGVSSGINSGYLNII